MTTRRSFLQRALAVSFGTALGGHRLFAATGPVHVVKRGDTLSGIAKTYGVTVRELKVENGLRSDLIQIGQTLRIPRQNSRDALAPVIAATRKIRVEPGRWRYIVSHHSAIERGNAAIYGSAHRRRGMRDGLAYHFVIGNGLDSGDGEIEIGDRWLRQIRGGHVRNANVNDHGIGICIVGNLENHPPTARQDASFFNLIEYLRNGFVAPGCKMTVHKWVDLRHTVCPGRHFPYAAFQKRYG